MNICENLRKSPAFQPYFLGRLLLLIPSLVLLIIGAFLLTSDSQMYAEVIAYETVDWAMPPITDFLTIPVSLSNQTNSTNTTNKRNLISHNEYNLFQSNFTNDLNNNRNRKLFDLWEDRQQQNLQQVQRIEPEMHYDDLSYFRFLQSNQADGNSSNQYTDNNNNETKNQCPSGYEKITGKFLGTRDICRISGNQYELGQCDKNRGTSVKGIPETDFDIFYGNILCIKRSQSLNYHQIVQLRGIYSCDDLDRCGSWVGSQKFDYGYCLHDKFTNCSLNGLRFISASDNSSADYQQYQRKQMLNYEKFDSITDNQLKSPLSRLVINLQRPCGSFKNKLIEREISISPVFNEEDRCSSIFEQDDMNEFYPTEFQITELTAYQQNNLMKAITDQLQTDQSVELGKNTYKLYGKPYALWTFSCQNEYSTIYFASQAQKMKQKSTEYKPACFIAIIVFCYELVTLLSQCLLFILFCALANFNNSLDEKMLKYVADHDCSDKIVNYSIKQFQSTNDRDQALAGFSVFVAFVQLAMQVVFTVMFTKKLKRYWDQFAKIFRKRYCQKKLQSQQAKHNKKRGKRTKANNKIEQDSIDFGNNKNNDQFDRKSAYLSVSQNHNQVNSNGPEHLDIITNIDDVYMSNQFKQRSQGLGLKGFKQSQDIYNIDNQRVQQNIDDYFYEDEEIKHQGGLEEDFDGLPNPYEEDDYKEIIHKSTNINQHNDSTKNYSQKMSDSLKSNFYDENSIKSQTMDNRQKTKDRGEIIIEGNLGGLSLKKVNQDNDQVVEVLDGIDHDEESIPQSSSREEVDSNGQDDLDVDYGLPQQTPNEYQTKL
eukprot:403372269